MQWLDEGRPNSCNCHSPITVPSHLTCSPTVRPRNHPYSALNPGLPNSESTNAWAYWSFQGGSRRRRVPKVPRGSARPVARTHPGCLPGPFGHEALKHSPAGQSLHFSLNFDQTTPHTRTQRGSTGCKAANALSPRSFSLPSHSPSLTLPIARPLPIQSSASP